MPLRSDPEGKRLPIKLDSTSNGEFVPIPVDATNRRANQLAQKWASENARRRGVDRRAFMVSACGAASTLLVSTAEQNWSKGRSKIGPLDVMPYEVLRVVPVVHRRDPRCFV